MVTIAFQPALARARAALERGQHAQAIAVLTQALKASGLKREDEVGLRCTLAEAWLLGDDLAQATAVLGRAPDAPRDTLPPALLSAEWRLHGRIAPTDYPVLDGEEVRQLAYSIMSPQQIGTMPDATLLDPAEASVVAAAGRRAVGRESLAGVGRDVAAAQVGQGSVEPHWAVRALERP